MEDRDDGHPSGALTVASRTFSPSSGRSVSALQQSPDFSHESPNVSISPLETLKVNEDEWNKLLEKSSAFYRSDPKLQTFEASLHAQAMNRYFMNSEGTTTRFGRGYYQLDGGGATQADDGMVIQRDHP